MIVESTTVSLAPTASTSISRDCQWWAEEAARIGTDWHGVIHTVLQMRVIAPCDVCGRQPCATPSFCQHCREADARAKASQRHRGKPSPRPAPKPTVEALTFALRRGVSELTKPDTQRRLSALDRDQLKEVCRRVQAFQPAIAEPWSADEVAALISAWRGPP
jgi:hypothetical protein